MAESDEYGGRRPTWPIVLLLMAVGTPTFAQRAEPPLAQRAVIIGIDGLAPFGIEASETPALDHLRSHGVWTFRARTVIPSVSACGWSAILMGAGPAETGITQNGWTAIEGRVPPIAAESDGLFPGLFPIARRQRPELTTAILYRWDGIADLLRPEMAPVYRQFGDDLALCDDACALIREQRPELLFLHLDDVDHAGHGHGWRSEEYRFAVGRADWYVGRILEALDGVDLLARTLVFVVSDHGGLGRSHGGVSADEMLVPWIVAGPGVPAGRELGGHVRNVDVTPTVIAALGLAPSPHWIGRVPHGVFEAGTRGSGLRRAPMARPMPVQPPARTSPERKAVARATQTDVRFALDAPPTDGAFRAEAGGFEARVVGGVTFTNDAPAAALFDGETGYLVVRDDIADLAGLPVREFTVMARARVDVPLRWGGLVSCVRDDGDAEAGWVLGYGPDRYTIGLATEGAADHDGTMTYLESKSELALGRWVHLAATYDGALLRIWVDGEPQGETTAQSGDILYAESGPWTIGAYRDTDELHPLTGAVAEVAIFPRVLSASELRRHAKRAR